MENWKIKHFSRKKIIITREPHQEADTSNLSMFPKECCPHSNYTWTNPGTLITSTSMEGRLFWTLDNQLELAKPCVFRKCLKFILEILEFPENLLELRQKNQVLGQCFWKILPTLNRLIKMVFSWQIFEFLRKFTWVFGKSCLSFFRMSKKKPDVILQLLCIFLVGSDNPLHLICLWLIILIIQFKIHG